MASAAEQLAAHMNFGQLGKATELKKRLWFTLGALIVYRLGTYIPLPGIDPAILQEIFRGWRAVADSYPGDRTFVAEAWVPGRPTRRRTGDRPCPRSSGRTTDRPLGGADGYAPFAPDRRGCGDRASRTGAAGYRQARREDPEVRRRG